MLIAYDKNNNRLYANSDERFIDCYCPSCGERLIHRKGVHNVPHFAHKGDSNCPYGIDKDSKSPWHIHMQELFSKDSIEVRFYDQDTGELHIADVFLKDSNTVIEFQHSHITDEEFCKRTIFHTNSGRRIVWIFDESKDGSGFGRLKKCEEAFLDYDGIHSELDFDWPRTPRKALNSIQTPSEIDRFTNYCICICYGENDTVHRIIRKTPGYEEILLSVHPIMLDASMCADDFFTPEEIWVKQSPWNEILLEKSRYLKNTSNAFYSSINSKRFSAFNMKYAKKRPRL